MVRRTKEEALATRHRLLDAAERLFQQQGVSHTSLQQIAQEAGTTRGAIYWHFKDKADLFNAMMERVTLPMEEAIRRTATAVGEDPLALIERGIMDALTRVADDPRARRVLEVASYMVEYTQEMANVRQRHIDCRADNIANFAKGLQMAARDRGVRMPVSAVAAAQGLHALVAGLIHDGLLDPRGFDLVSTGRRLLRAYLRGLGLDIEGAGDVGTRLKSSERPQVPGPRPRSAIITGSRRVAERRPRRISMDRIRPSEG